MKKMLAPSLIVSFLALILVFTRDSSAARAANGKAIYDRTCLPCHGATGRGDGKGAALFQPKPQNFTDPAFWQGNVDQKIYRNVMGFGKKMGKMDLDPDEITTVTAYITQQFKPVALGAPALRAEHQISSQLCTNLGECSSLITEMTDMLKSGKLSPAEEREVLKHIERTSRIMQEMSSNPEGSPTPKQTQELQDIRDRMKRIREMQRPLGKPN
jgi:mono/diheme cytochrome c family protein